MIRHGIRYSYVYYKCRCAPCTDANAAYCAQATAARQRRLEEAPHGTRGGYNNWGCRCRSCTDAHSAYLQEYKRHAQVLLMAAREDAP